VKALFDTNILIDFTRGVEAACVELDGCGKAAVSRIVWIEFLVGATTPALETQRRHLLREFEVVEIDAAVARQAVSIRQTTRLRLPDAIILATARVHDMLLVTSNHRDFSRRDPNVRIPY
jgi:predicted nucleic acid-binding protein